MNAAELRLIVSPEDVELYRDAIQSVFDVRRCRNYPSTKSDDRILYADVAPKKFGSSSPSFPDRIEDMQIRLKDRDGRNRVVVVADFAAPFAVHEAEALRLNAGVQNAIRDIYSEASGVAVRIDQSRPPKLRGALMDASGAVPIYY